MNRVFLQVFGLNYMKKVLSPTKISGRTFWRLAVYRLFKTKIFGSQTKNQAGFFELCKFNLTYTNNGSQHVLDQACAVGTWNTTLGHFRCA